MTRGGRGRNQGPRGGEKQEQRQAPKPNIQNRPFCTQQCLLALAYGGPIDAECLNSHQHGQSHISRLEFLRLIRDQLAVDRGRDADCAPLHLSGSRGSLFKVRLSTHGYTLVAKGMKSLDGAYLQHENKIYDQLQAIQGKHVPVCLGSIDLVRPCHYDGGRYVHFMFLSWAGRPLFDCGGQANKAGVVKAVTTIFEAIHKSRVLHRDAEPRNILYDGGNLMVVDFERAKSYRRQPPDALAHPRARVGLPGIRCLACLASCIYTIHDNGMHYAKVDYGKLDLEDEVVSENATRSIFTWLRSEGYPASEKGIPLHEWLEHYESDDNKELEDLESTSTGKNCQSIQNPPAFGMSYARPLKPRRPPGCRYRKE